MIQSSNSSPSQRLDVTRVTFSTWCLQYEGEEKLLNQHDGLNPDWCGQTSGLHQKVPEIEGVRDLIFFAMSGLHSNRRTPALRGGARWIADLSCLSSTYIYIYIYIYHIYIYIHDEFWELNGIDVKSFICEDKSCYVGNPCDSFLEFPKGSRKLDIIITYNHYCCEKIYLAKGCHPLKRGVRENKGSGEFWFGSGSVFSVVLWDNHLALHSLQPSFQRRGFATAKHHGPEAHPRPSFQK